MSGESVMKVSTRQIQKLNTRKKSLKLLTKFSQKKVFLFRQALSQKRQESHTVQYLPIFQQ